MFQMIFRGESFLLPLDKPQKLCYTPIIFLNKERKNDDETYVFCIRR